ncbi:MAG TPA: pyridoxamine 5'-phosphate oxidase family protein [Egibacteraceae bacterium]|nr:pyridoxamine 5'-phosphate oxidase family protein [Egibacteraceae bacterium]
MSRAKLTAVGPDRLSRDECTTLLRTAGLGRIAFIVDDCPVVVPVNFAADGDAVVFRVERGGPLEVAVAGSAVAFEVDSIDPATRSGWSVLVQGVAEAVTADDEVRKLEDLELHPWAPGPRSRYIRLRATAVSGRRVPAGQSGIWLG